MFSIVLKHFTNFSRAKLKLVKFPRLQNSFSNYKFVSSSVFPWTIYHTSELIFRFISEVIRSKLCEECIPLIRFISHIIVGSCSFGKFSSLTNIQKQRNKLPPVTHASPLLRWQILCQEEKNNLHYILYFNLHYCFVQLCQWYIDWKYSIEFTVLEADYFQILSRMKHTSIMNKTGRNIHVMKWNDFQIPKNILHIHL